MSTDWDRVRAIADAVLYEGYLLYPYRATSGKNQSRWQFGVLGPRQADERGIGEDGTMSAQMLLDPGPDAALTIVVRCLQLQRRTAERRGERRLRTGRSTDRGSAVVAHLGRGGGVRAVVRPVRRGRSGGAANASDHHSPVGAMSSRSTAAAWYAAGGNSAAS